MRVIAGLAAGVALLLPAQAGAQTPKERAPAFKKLVDCRAIADAQQRLACFDREVAAVDAAEASKELVVFDRAQVRRTQRSLFGLSLPDLNIFGDGDETAQKEINTTIKRAWEDAASKWNFELADGARWRQTDSRELIFEPEPGAQIRIRRATLGTYLANVDKEVAMRVERVR
jgi:hypothetical protein